MANGFRSLIRRSAIDLTPLRSLREFRLLFIGGTVTSIGSMITYVALPFQIKQLTGSYLLVGILGLVELVPLVVFGLYGGALADSVDRRTMALFTEAAFMVMSALLLVNALVPRPSLIPIYVFAFLSAALDGLQRPSLEALLPRIVPHDQLASAGAINNLSHTLATMLGPALGGILIATAGVWAGYAVDMVSFLASLIALALMRPVPPSRDAESPSLRVIGEGLSYAWSRKDLLGTYLADLSAMFLAFPYALFPFVADELHAPWSLGLLYSAGFAGGAIAMTTSGWSRRVHRHGRAIVYASALSGAALPRSTSRHRYGRPWSFSLSRGLPTWSAACSDN